MIHTPKIKKQKLSKNTHWGAIALLTLLTLIGYLLIVSEAAAHGIDLKPTEAVYAPTTKQEPQKPQSTTPAPKPAPQTKSSPLTASQQEVEALIRRIAGEMGFGDADFLVRLARCESGLRPNALGDHGQSRGLFQIYRPAHPTVTDEQAYNPEWAIRWTINKINAGGVNIWTCTRLI